MRNIISFVLVLFCVGANAQSKPAVWVKYYTPKSQMLSLLQSSSELTKAFFPYFDYSYQHFDYLKELYPAMDPIEIDEGRLYGVVSYFDGRLRQNPEKLDVNKAAYYSFIFVKDGQYDGVVNMSMLDLEKVKVMTRNGHFVEVTGRTTFPAGTLKVTRTLFIHDNKLEDLIFMKPDDLRLARNFIFAQYGYIFKLPEFQQYFSAKPWYKPLHEDVNNLLTEKDKALVAEIQLLERLRVNSPLAH